MKTKLYLPCRTVSESNSRDHWAKKAQRTRKLRCDAGYLVLSAGLPRGKKGWLVELCRVAPRDLDDHDNLRAALKAVADGVTNGLGLLDDRDGIEWWYRQRRGKPKEYGVEITISRKKAVNNG